MTSFTRYTNLKFEDIVVIYFNLKKTIIIKNIKRNTPTIKKKYNETDFIDNN